MWVNRTLVILLILSSFVSYSQLSAQASQDDRSVEPMSNGISLYYAENRLRLDLDAQGLVDQENYWNHEKELILLRMSQWKMMGINSLCISFPIFTDNWQSTSIFAHPHHTPSIEQLVFITRAAKDQGMAVMLKPQLDEQVIQDTGGLEQWRGTIVLDTDKYASAWFLQLTALLTQYTMVDQVVQPDWLAIGTELNSLETQSYEAEWEKLLTSLHASAPKVNFTYAQNWDQAYHQIYPSWFKSLDGYAIDAYFPLEGLTELPSAEQIAAELETYRYIPEGLRQRFGDKEIILTEVGVASMGRAPAPDGRTVFDAPWLWGGEKGGPPDMMVQVAYIDGACMAYQQWHADGLISGMYVWRTGIYQLNYPLEDNSHEIFGKPAQAALRQCYHAPE